MTLLVRTGSTLLVRADTPWISKNPKFLAPKSADVLQKASEDPSLFALEKAPLTTGFFYG